MDKSDKILLNLVGRVADRFTDNQTLVVVGVLFVAGVVLALAI